MPKPTHTLTAAKRNKIAKSIGDGLSQAAAFTLAGVNKYTGNRWLRQGKDDLQAGKLDTDYAKLVQAIEEARSNLEETIIKKIRIVGVDVDAFTFLKYLRDQEAKREALDAESAGGMGGYTPPPVGK